MNLMLVLKDVFKKDQIKSYIYNKKRELENFTANNNGKLNVTVTAERGRSKSPNDQFRCTLNYQPIGKQAVYVERTNENFVAAIHGAFDVLKGRVRNEQLFQQKRTRLPVMQLFEPQEF